MRMISSNAYKSLVGALVVSALWVGAPVYGQQAAAPTAPVAPATRSCSLHLLLRRIRSRRAILIVRSLQCRRCRSRTRWIPVCIRRRAGGMRRMPLRLWRIMRGWRRRMRMTGCSRILCLRRRRGFRASSMSITTTRDGGCWRGWTRTTTRMMRAIWMRLS